MSFFRQLLILIVVVALGAGGYYAWQRYAPGGEPAGTLGAGNGPAGSAPPVRIVTVAPATLVDSIEAVGTTRARQSLEIVPLANGTLVEIGFAPGARIAAGAVLARLDDDIERADLREAEAKAVEADRALERSRALRSKTPVWGAPVDKLVAAPGGAEAELGRARRGLADRAVLAPFAGTVGLKRVDIGARVTSTTVLTTLDDLGQVEIEFAVPEIFFGRVGADHRVVADAAASPDRVFAGAIPPIDGRGDAASRAFKVRATLPNDDAALPAGMFMHIRVVLAEREALTVPEAAIFVEGANSFVFTVADGKAAKRPVVTGTRRPGIVEIVEGLATGDVIVSSGLQRVRDGAPVRILGDKPAAAAEGSGACRSPICRSAVPSSRPSPACSSSSSASPR